MQPTKVFESATKLACLVFYFFREHLHKTGFGQGNLALYV